MKRAVCTILSLVLGAVCMLAGCLTAAAHSGRTDKNGGHYDRSTGDYHYHHGYPAHQHPGGICPYAQTAPAASAPKSSAASSSQPRYTSIPLEDFTLDTSSLYKGVSEILFGAPSVPLPRTSPPAASAASPRPTGSAADGDGLLFPALAGLVCGFLSLCGVGTVGIDLRKGKEKGSTFFFVLLGSLVGIGALAYAFSASYQTLFTYLLSLVIGSLLSGLLLKKLAK